jgi:hypothetical protein
MNSRATCRLACNAVQASASSALAMSAAVQKPTRIAKVAKQMRHMVADPVKDTRSGARRRRR